MIRSCSEAICETVGSIMNQHAGKNRHLQPQYFSMEIYLRFNLGPLHLMKDLIKEVLSDKNSKSFRKVFSLFFSVTEKFSDFQRYFTPA